MQQQPQYKPLSAAPNVWAFLVSHHSLDFEPIWIYAYAIVYRVVQRSQQQSRHAFLRVSACTSQCCREAVLAVHACYVDYFAAAPAAAACVAACSSC